MTDTIFYSWQSDSPNKTNRGFIEDAIKTALKELGREDSDLSEAVREMEVDKDTKGVAGSPAITDTIFQKIDQAGIFISDMTFVGSTASGRLIPNPNVLLEHGWALKSLGDNRIMSIMNEAYGVVTSVNLPFDLRHKTWPIRYRLEEGADAPTKRAEKKQLVRVLKSGIRDILATVEPDPATLAPAYTPLQPANRISSFLNEGDLLGKHAPWNDTEKMRDIRWTDSPQMFIRLIPEIPVPEKTPAELLRLLDSPNTTMLGRFASYWTMGNEHGAVRFATNDQAPQTQTNQIVQVTEQGEIWAIDGETLGNPKYHIPYCEVIFASRLAEFMSFARDTLGVTSSVSVILGFSGIQGQLMYLPTPPHGTHWPGGKQTGPSAKNDLVMEIGNVSLVPPKTVQLIVPEGYPYETPKAEPCQLTHAYETLIPFFLKAWGNFQFDRPAFLPHL